MNLGFDTLKDLLDVVTIPIVILVLGFQLPRMVEEVKTRKFVALIRRELAEMGPKPKKKTKNGKWHKHLTKRFMHEEIFANITENRDFILSLPPDISYTTKQLWIHFEKGRASHSEKELAEHGASWCDYLHSLCSIFDARGNEDFYKNVYQPWEDLILEYHPNLERTGRLKMKSTLKRTR